MVSVHIKVLLVLLLIFPAHAYSATKIVKQNLVGVWFDANKYFSVEFNPNDTYVAYQEGKEVMNGSYKLIGNGKKLNAFRHKNIRIKMSKNKRVLKLRGLRFSELHKVYRVKADDLHGIWYTTSSFEGVEDKYYVKYMPGNRFKALNISIDHNAKTYKVFKDTGKFKISFDYTITDITENGTADPYKYVLLNKTEKKLTAAFIESVGEPYDYIRVNAIPGFTPPVGYTKTKQ